MLTVCYLWICSFLLLRPQTRSSIILLLFLFKKVIFEAIPFRHCCLHFSKWLMLWNSAFLSARCGRGILMIKVHFIGRKIDQMNFMGSSILFHTFYICRKPLGGKLDNRISHLQLKNHQINQPPSWFSAEITCTSEQLVQAKPVVKNYFEKCHVLTLATVSFFA